MEVERLLAAIRTALALWDEYPEEARSLLIAALEPTETEYAETTRGPATL